MNSTTIQKSGEEILALAEMLENSLRILHSRSYAAALKAVRVLRVVAHDPLIDEEEDRTLLKGLVEELTYASTTVYPPASDHLLDTVHVLSAVLAADAAAQTA